MGVPNPEHELARLRKTLGGGFPPVVVISGASPHFRGEAMDAALAALPDKADLRALSGDKDTDGSELQSLRGGSLFGSGSYVVVRRGEPWLKAHGAALLEIMGGIGDGCGLVLETAKLDKRTKLGKALAKGALFEFRGLYDEPYDRSRSPLEAEMVGWIVDRARKAKLRLTKEAALLLMQTVGTDPQECLAQIGRLAARGRKGTLGPQDIAGELPCSFESTQFEFVNALLDRDRRRAERSLEALYQRGVRGRDGGSSDRGAVFPMVVSWLYRSMAGVYEGRFLVDRGVSVRDVAGRLGVRTFVTRFQGQVSGNSAAQLRRGLDLLHRAQRDLRLTGEDPQWILRRFVDRYFAEGAA